ncbi:PREDICTED: uncharacterized protein LOC107333990 isoform X2 [Acropora digitifera]|uniref:uncharacterized protein LOC107333990 isoform X2 n=1 Tax=Acropora digitifera TaxID=70779 RepID=UPI00077A8C8A|nr:PREDICTED: uncharacterized protein LOC107333990 isoform X2 [Acropora digitifera]
MLYAIQWPAGTYGIPKPKTGCPSSDGFQWMTGSRSQDTNNDTSKNNKSASFHLDAVVDKKKVKRSFCLKTSTAKDQNRNIWPSGQYCIYKKGSCPDGLNDGFVYWDDDDKDKNKNNKSGTLPDGDYDSNTKIEFCCRTDGNENNPVVLPTKEQFYLLAYEFPRCQMVKWAVSSLEWIYYDTEDWDNNDRRGGAYPYNAATQHPTIYYCYYRGCNKTLTAMNGTFHSPNYPNKHSDGEYCSWKISVSPGNRIRLTFSNPSFHEHSVASNLIVYDGEHVSGEVLGVFYGSLPPPGNEFYSSSNNMLVVFVSKATNSYTGFNASYNFIEKRATDPINWPAGTYGIPRPVSGCPSVDGFQWMTGWRSQEAYYYESNNNKSASFHLDAVVNKQKVKRSFCLKTSTAKDQNRTTWPSGQYCIYKKGNCPEYLNYGFVYWDDSLWNRNSKSGTLPDGVFGFNTKIEFCCRTDGNKDKPVVLPTKEPFYLLAYKSPGCQMVKWAVSTLEWIYYDTEDYDNRGGAYPYNAGKQHPTIYYCHYRGCNQTLTAMNGTFRSPNYPNKRSDGEYCSWKISVSPGNRIRLTFSNLSFHNQNDASKLIVYDGENVSGEVLGVFYGNLPPAWKELYSSSNHMLVIFVSNASDSYTGFNASYSFIERTATPAPTILTTKQRPDVISSTYTEIHLSTTDDLNEESGKNKQKRQSDEEGVNVVAIVVPLSGLVLVALLLVGVFFYCRRKRNRKGESGNPRDTVHFRTTGAETTLVENPTYDLTVNHSDMTRKGESNLTANAITTTSENANQLYTEIEGKEEQYIQTRETYAAQQNENPLYESAADEAVSNPLYDSNLIIEMKNREAYLEQQEENPLYE